MRFEGSMNVDINDIITNLIPFPNLNLISSGMAPLFSQNDLKCSSKVLDQMFSDILTPSNQLLSLDPRNSVLLASALIVRGKVEISDLRRNIERYVQIYAD
jgi:tubulin epsilon